MANIFYQRVSTAKQNEERQETLVSSKYDIDRTFTDKQTGTNTDRPALTEMLSYARKGDTVIVESYSRLSRSTKDLLNLVDQFQKDGIEFISIKENIDTTTPTGKLFLTIMAGISEFDVSIMKERQKEGIALAQANGKHFGNKKLETPENFLKVYTSWKNKEMTGVKAFNEMGISKASFYRLVKEHEETK